MITDVIVEDVLCSMADNLLSVIHRESEISSIAKIGISLFDIVAPSFHKGIFQAYQMPTKLVSAH